MGDTYGDDISIIESLASKTIIQHKLFKPSGVLCQIVFFVYKSYFSPDILSWPFLSKTRNNRDKNTYLTKHTAWFEQLVLDNS